MKKLNKKQKTLVVAIDLLEDVLSNMDDDDYDLYIGTEPKECLNDQDLLALSVIRPLAQRIVANKEDDGSTDYLDAKQLAEWTEWLCKRHL